MKLGYLAWIAGTVGSVLAVTAAAQPVSPALTYQGELRAAGQPAAGPVDLRFRLYDAAAGGNQVGGTIDRPGVVLSQGRFMQELDFGAGAFGADSRYLEIDVRSPGGGGSYVTLTPRQKVTAAPVAQFALNGNPGPQGPAGPPCYPDCNGDGLLNLADFGCFQTRFALGNPQADCNGDLVLNLADFGCFQTRFAIGCP